MLFTNHFQNAYVTRDLDGALELMKNRFGIREFQVLDVDADVATPEGIRNARCRAAMGWASPSYMVELIEPMNCEVDIYSEFLPKDNSPRFHHMCMRTFDWDATRKQLDDEGWTIAIEHCMEEGLNYVYVDARETLGHYIEYLWATPEMWGFIGGQ